MRGHSTRLLGSLLALSVAVGASAEELRSIPLKSKVTSVQPMTGIVLWSTNSATATAPIQLEFAYLTYDTIVREEGQLRLGTGRDTA